MFVNWLITYYTIVWKSTNNLIATNISFLLVLKTLIKIFFCLKLSLVRYCTKHISLKLFSIRQQEKSYPLQLRIIACNKKIFTTDGCKGRQNPKPWVDSSPPRLYIAWLIRNKVNLLRDRYKRTPEWLIIY